MSVTATSNNKQALRDLETFIQASIQSVGRVDVDTLLTRVAALDEKSMADYWSGFVTNAARAAANEWPDWKSRQQMAALKSKHYELAKPADVPLQDHVVKHVLLYIDQECQKTEAFRRLPWVARIHARVTFAFIVGIYAVCLMVPVAVVGAIIVSAFHIHAFDGLGRFYDQYSGQVKVWFAYAWCALTLSAWVIGFVIHRKNRND